MEKNIEKGIYLSYRGNITAVIRRIKEFWLAIVAHIKC